MLERCRNPTLMVLLLALSGDPFFSPLFLWASLMPQMVENLPTVQETWVPSLSWEDPLEEEKATHPSILAWRMPWTGEPGRLQSLELERHDLVTKQEHTQTVCGPQSCGCHHCFPQWSCLGHLSVLPPLPQNPRGCVAFFPLSQLFSSAQSLSRVWLCDPMNCSPPGSPIHPQLSELAQTHAHWVSDAIQPLLSHPLSSPSPPAFNPSQHQCLL